MTYSFIEGKDFQEVRNKIKLARQKYPHNQIVFLSSHSNDELTQQVLEKEKVDVLLIKLSGRKDKMKQRNSGFNQVLAKLAKKNNISIGIPLDEIIESTGKEKADILARIKQNIKLCNKNKLKMKFIAIKKENERDVYDLKSLGLVLGMPTRITSKL